MWRDVINRPKGSLDLTQLNNKQKHHRDIYLVLDVVHVNSECRPSTVNEKVYFKFYWQKGGCIENFIKQIAGFPGELTVRRLFFIKTIHHSLAHR